MTTVPCLRTTSLRTGKCLCLISRNEGEGGEPAQLLIRAMARGMGMEEPDHLAEPAFAERIWLTSGGVTGNFKRILHWSGKVARRHDRRFVTQDDITEALQLFTPYSPE